MGWIRAAFMILFVAPLKMFLGELAGGLDLTAFAIALVSLESLLAFLVNESRHQTPLLDLSVFGEKKSVLPIISITLLIISSFALFILGPFYFKGVMVTRPPRWATVF
jgi:hypothetical protein